LLIHPIAQHTTDVEYVTKPYRFTKVSYRGARGVMVEREHVRKNAYLIVNYPLQKKKGGNLSQNGTSEEKLFLK
jgi:hypothetical protein